MFAAWIKKIIIVILLLICFSGSAQAAEPSGYWDTHYLHYKQITITNNDASILSSGYSVKYDFDHAALVTAGKSLASGADIRIAYWNGSAWVELDRAQDLSTSWNSTTSRIWFKLQQDIGVGATDHNYYLYYDYPSATVPTYDSQVVSVASTTIYDKIYNATVSNLLANHSTFNDSSDYWRAAPGYVVPFVLDTWYAFSNYPSYFTANQVKNFYNKVISAKNLSGDFPIALNVDSTAFAYYSAWDSGHYHVTGDGNFIVPQMEKLYFDKSGDITDFASTASYLKTALSHIPRDAGTKLVTVVPGDEWVAWGFQDMVRKTGNDLMGSLLYYKASLDMAALYTANGDSANATFFTNEANDIKNNIATLWDNTDGMFYAATIQNHQIDVQGSAYAAYLGITTPEQSAAISSYLVANYDTLTADGYILQSPTGWANCYYINGGASIYGAGAYDNGMWSVANEWIATSLKYTSPTKAFQYIQDFSNNPDMTIEYYGVGASNGFSNNLESPMGAYKFMVDNPDLFANMVYTSSDFNNVFSFWDDFTTASAGWTNVVGSWQNLEGLMHSTTAIGNNDNKKTYDISLSDNFLVQADMKLNSYVGTDTPVSGVCINSTDTGGGTARGYCSTFRGNDQGHALILNEQVAWGSGSLLTWSSSKWYRTQIARIGSNIYRKTWPLSTSEPVSWQETYVQGNNLSATNISLLSGFSVADFNNVLARKYVSSEPSSAAGVEHNIYSFYATPSSIVQYTTGNTVTLTGIGSSWTPGTPGTPVFTLSGGTGASIISQTVTSSTQAVLSVAAGSATGTLTITDAGAGVSTSITITLDSTAPTISSVTSTPGSSNADISWTTNENASSKVEYGQTISYDTTTVETDTLTRLSSHTVSLSGLVACTSYHYRVISTDYATNEATGSDNTFTTTGCAAPPSLASSSSSNSSSSSDSSNTQYTCGDSSPSAPNLFQIDVRGTSTKLFFTPLPDTGKFYLSYSTSPSGEEHGVEVTLAREGVQNYTINLLKPNTIYYFKLRGQRGCMPGDWSNILKAKTGNTTFSRTISYYLNSVFSRVSSTLHSIKVPKQILSKPSVPVSTPVPQYEEFVSTPKPVSSALPTKKQTCLLWWCW